MIIDFHVHVLPPEDMPAFTGTGFHRNIRATKSGKPPTTIENAVEAAKIGGVDITVISNPIHNLCDMDRAQQLERGLGRVRLVQDLMLARAASSTWRAFVLTVTGACSSRSSPVQNTSR